MKFYRYILYKLLKFRSLISIKAVEFPGRVMIDTAGLMLPFCLFFFATGPVLLLRYLHNAGAVRSRASSELLFVALTFPPLGLVWWLNYRLLRSSNWQRYAIEFAAYPRRKRFWGSVLVFLVLIGILIGSLFLLHYLNL